MKIHRVDAARKEYRCNKCSENIEVGQPYVWWQPYHSSVVRWHSYHGVPPNSELTSSDKKKHAYKAREIVLEYLAKIYNETVPERRNRSKIEMLLGDWNNVFTRAYKMAGDVQQQYHKSAKTIEYRFGETPISVYCKESRDKINDWISALHDIDAVWKENVQLLKARMNDDTFFHYTRDLMANYMNHLHNLDL